MIVINICSVNVTTIRWTEPSPDASLHWSVTIVDRHRKSLIPLREHKEVCDRKRNSTKCQGLRVQDGFKFNKTNT